MNAAANAQPLLVLGDRRRDAMLARVKDAARRWRESWAPGVAETFEAHCDSPAPGGFAGAVAAATTSCWAVARGDERIAVVLLPHATFVWCVQEAGAVAAGTGGEAAPDSLAEQLEREVVESLVAQLADGAALTASRIGADAVPEWSRLARAWTLRIVAASRSLTLLLAAARVEMLAPTRGVGRGHALRPRRDAIGENLLMLRAVVGDTAMSVSELAALTLDDVLVLDQRLAEPIALVSRATGVPVASGNLGRSGARRAIKVAGISAHRN